MAVIEVQNRQHWNHILNNHKAVVVDVFLDSCEPCKHLKPKFQQLAADYRHPDVKFVSEDNKLQINPVTGVPSVLFFLDGKPFETILGGNFQEIVQTLQKLFQALNIGPPMARDHPMGNVAPPQRRPQSSVPKGAQASGYARYADLSKSSIAPYDRPETNYIPQANSVRNTYKRNVVRNVVPPSVGGPREGFGGGSIPGSYGAGSEQYGGGNSYPGQYGYNAQGDNHRLALPGQQRGNNGGAYGNY
jgi:thiol-disulfide isomerase/thioredoxin